jgi:hypothetical protein
MNTKSEHVYFESSGVNAAVLATGSGTTQVNKSLALLSYCFSPLLTYGGENRFFGWRRTTFIS